MQWSTLPPEQQEAIRDAWLALALLDQVERADGLEEHQSAKTDAPVRLRDLAMWAAADPTPLPVGYKRALLASPDLRRDFNVLLRSCAVAVGDRAAAASTGMLDRREGTGFEIRLVASRAGDGFFVLISFHDLAVWGGWAPGLLVVTAPDGRCETLTLLEADSQGAQVLCRTNDPILALLGHPETELLLL